MTSPEDSAQELRDLCDRLLDGELTTESRQRLEALVLADARLRRLYVETMHLHAALRQNASGMATAPLAEVLAALPPEPENVVRGPFSRWGWQAAAAVLLAVGLAWWLRPVAFATLVESKGARWESSSLPTEPGSKLPAGRLRLAEGVARLIFRSGAEVSLEGPAELELTGQNACFLHSGALVAHVPESAHGFAVGTANARLIDHGTDFGISTDPAGQAQVQVLKGEVELQHGHSGEKLRLLSRESARVTKERLTSDDQGTGEKEPDRYAFVRPASATGAGKTTVSITTAGGVGEAAYVVSPNSPIHFSDTLLLLKNGNSRNYQRKAYLKFDLTALRERKVTDAALTLNFESTGFGYASLTDDCTFAVYGVTDDSADDWTAETLTWENAPAYDPDAGKVDSTRAVKLGTFSTPRGVVTGSFAVQGDALTSFVNADANRRATLVVVRETQLPGNAAAVHGFAGNHHPTLAPPTLRLTVAAR